MNLHVFCLVFLVSFFVQQSTCQIVITDTTCVPSRGGWVTLTGSGFNTVDQVTVRIGAFNCTKVAVVSYTMATCQLPPSPLAGRVPLFINNVRSSLDYYFCPPVVSSVQANATNTSTQVTIFGENFGKNASAISVSFARLSDKFPFTCQSLTLVSPPSSPDYLTCTLPDIKDRDKGQFKVRMSLAGQNSPSNGVVGFEIAGGCYSKSYVDKQWLDLTLTQLSLKKNLAKLKTLVEDLKQIKKTLPRFDESSCCDGQLHYPVPHVEIQFLSSDSFEFKDCVDSFCAQREQFLVSL